MTKDNRKELRKELKNLSWLDMEQIKMIMANPSTVRMYDDLMIGDLKQEDYTAEIIGKYL